MNQLSNIFKLGGIVETLYSNLGSEVEFALSEEEVDGLLNFCIDSKGVVRKGVGMVAMSSDYEDHPEYVPSNRYDIKLSPWNSHSLYFEMELPNPAENFEYYTLIRTAMLTELTNRVNRVKKNAQARLRREAKKRAQTV